MQVENAYKRVVLTTINHSTFQQLADEMNLILVVLCALVLIATGAVKGAAIGIGAAPAVVATADHPQYAFNYAVNDPHTRDKKAQWELRDGGDVKGSYSLVEPDGSIRVVDYTASDLQGFNAVVQKIGPSLHPPAPPHVAPLVAKAVGPLTSVVGPINYGFGAAPITPVISNIASIGHWNLPWDPVTHSFGGWVPLAGPLILPTGPQATIYSKKVVNGKVHRWTTGPISLLGHKIIIKKKHG